ncbi:MAG: homogentisate 1,2-dioxygenase [Bryobacteraceae bacterium]|nr:homogentisate 1,2-dioxygenase [Bryobacteraceae bacterium]
MPVYHQLGEIPRKRHQVFRQKSGELYAEELVGNMGFTGPASLLYHVHRPTAVKSLRAIEELKWNAVDHPLRHRHFRTKRFTARTSAITGRIPLLFNADVSMQVVLPDEEVTAFYRNAQGDEIIYVSDGEGVLESPFGKLAFRDGDYLVIPRGILHRYRFAKAAKLLIIESAGYVRTPKRYRNEYGQLTENAPYSERDFRKPVDLETHDERGDFPLIVKKANQLTELVLAHHPFDLVGWDGYYYPWAFSIHDFEPRVGRFHLPPPIHQTFDGDGFVVCSFCPRPYDFDPTAVPAPYAHSNVMSDEVIYYANSEFMSRKGIEYGSVTLHPDGLSHGPQPGRTEASLGQKQTDELAVMLDTFRPLHVSQEALAIEDEEYYLSWMKE